ncbi:YebC/PmpR family DNA-binding transcriptional regulator, partial [Corynebacterium diphtheriae]
MEADADDVVTNEDGSIDVFTSLPASTRCVKWWRINLGTDGSVAYLFERKGQITFAPGTDEDALMEAAMEADADDVVTNEDGSIDVFTSLPASTRCV